MFHVHKRAHGVLEDIYLRNACVAPASHLLVCDQFSHADQDMSYFGRPDVLVSVEIQELKRRGNLGVGELGGPVDVPSSEQKLLVRTHVKRIDRLVGWLVVRLFGWVIG